jgi:hypothetical protein
LWITRYYDLFFDLVLEIKRFTSAINNIYFNTIIGGSCFFASCFNARLPYSPHLLICRIGMQVQPIRTARSLLPLCEDPRSASELSPYKIWDSTSSMKHCIGRCKSLLVSNVSYCQCLMCFIIFSLCGIRVYIYVHADIQKKAKS